MGPVRPSVHPPAVRQLVLLVTQTPFFTEDVRNWHNVSHGSSITKSNSDHRYDLEVKNQGHIY